MPKRTGTDPEGLVSTSYRLPARTLREIRRLATLYQATCAGIVVQAVRELAKRENIAEDVAGAG